MVQRCPDCGAAAEDAPWCGSCGALLERPAGAQDADGDAEAGDRAVRRAVAAAVAVVVVGALVVASGGEPPAAPPAPAVPVEEAEVLAPPLPPSGVVGRQFAASGSILWERTDLPAVEGGARSLVSDGTVVAVVDAGETVLTVDASTGEDVTQPAPTSPPGRLTFTVDGEDLEVVLDGAVLRGVVQGEAIWEVDLADPPAAAPVRTGTSLVLALSSGEVVALAPADGQERWRRDLGSAVTAVAGDGTVLLAGTGDGRVLRLDPSGLPVTTVPVGPGAVRDLVAGRRAVALVEERLVGFDVAG